MLFLVNSERPTRQQKMRSQLCVSDGVTPINRDPERLEEIEHLVPGMQLRRSVVFSFCPLKQANKTTAFVILYGEQSVHV